MKLKTFTVAALCAGVGLFSVSCEKDSLDPQTQTQNGPQAVNSAATDQSTLNANLNTLLNVKIDRSDNQFSKLITNGVIEPTECGPTALDPVIDVYVSEFGPLEFQYYGLLATINQLYAFIDDSPQYFAADGRLTNFATKHKRNLESFWNMPGEITLNGQHNATLLDRDAIAAVYLAFTSLTEAQAYANADFLVSVMQSSEVFQTTPLLSLDGFATTGDLIVIGDGIVQAMVDAGVEEKVVFAGIFGHEWAHQIQFNNYLEWYGVDREDLVSTPETTRMAELEADFLTGYYLTHKRGGTYNWKRVTEFLDLFFAIGDCSFESTGHHGTPLQRFAASELGYLIADTTFPKGKILSADELHDIFMANYDDILNNTISVNSL